MARTKAFEIDAVLDKAMRLFWTQGYEKNVHAGPGRQYGN